MDFSIFNSFFDKIYVITLKRATDRHVKFQKELAGLNYIVFYGQDKKEFNVEDLKKKGIYDEEQARKNERHSNPLPPGMIGASWSHRLVYEDMIKNNIQKALIFEDDMVINKNYWELLPQIFKDLPGDWGFLYFGFEKNEHAPPSANLKKAFYHLLRFFKLIKYSHKTISNLYPKRITENLYKAGYHDCIHAYGITLEAARILVKLQTPIAYFPDNVIAHAITNELINGYVTIPKIIDQEFQLGISSHSYINE